jgi:hypothetical protein
MSVVTVQGYVQDAITGNPIAGASVSAYAHNDVNAAGVLLGTDAATDANGRFDIAGITLQQMDLKITNAGQVYWAKGKQTGSFGDVYFESIVNAGTLASGTITVSGSVTVSGVTTTDSLHVNPLSASVTNVPVLIERPTIVPAVTTIPSFTVIPTTFKHLKIVGQVRWAGGTFFQDVGFIFNDDFFTNHYLVQPDPDSAPVYSPYGKLGLAPPPTAIAGSCCSFEAIIFNYNDTNFNKHVLAYCLEGDLVGSFVSGSIASMWLNTSAITKINVGPYNSPTITWGTGSNVALYGIP